MTSDDDTASETHHEYWTQHVKPDNALIATYSGRCFLEIHVPNRVQLMVLQTRRFFSVSIYGRMGYVKKPAFIANCSEICFHVIHARSFHWCHYLDELLYCCRFRVLLQSFFFEFMRCSNFNSSSHLRKTRHKCVLVVIVAMHSVVFLLMLRFTRRRHDVILILTPMPNVQCVPIVNSNTFANWFQIWKAILNYVWNLIHSRKVQLF